VIPARSSRHGHLLARANHADVARKIHLSQLFSFPEPPLHQVVEAVWTIRSLSNARAT
jgi:hypothetical protein